MKNKKGLIIAIIIVAVVMCLSCCCCSSILLGNNKNKDEEASESVSTTSNSTEEAKNADVTETTNESKSISTSYVDNQIGDTVNANGLEITINSIQPVKTWSDDDSYEVSISFKNNTDKSISLNPYDWHSVSDNGNDVAHVGGDGSFNIKSLKKGEAWDAKLTLWNKNAVKIKYDSNLTEDNAEHPYITWVIPNTTQVTTTAATTIEKTTSVETVAVYTTSPIIITAPIIEPTQPELSTVPQPSVTLGEKNALSSAKSYISLFDFSYQGMYDQLIFDGYTDSEARYGADNCGADWNEEAAKAAKNYLDIFSFSRQELIDQLLYDGFTQSEAEYGVTQAGY